MIRGEFDDLGRPFVDCYVNFPRLHLGGRALFLLDTGAGNTCLHSDDAGSLGIPFDALGNRMLTRGIGGRSTYFRETALLTFADESRTRGYMVSVLIASPYANTQGLPSILGRNVVNNWFMEYDPSTARLDFTVRHADYTLEAAGG